MGDQDETLDLEDVSVDERPLALPPELPLLPLRDTVLFPNSFMPLAVARETSVRLIDEAIAGTKLIGVFTQRDAALDEPHQDDLYPIGTATHIHKMFRLPDGSLRLIVQGLSRWSTRTGSRSTRCSGTSRATSRRSSRFRLCSPTISRRSR
jgi:ATP-dependent Lon protease